MNKKLNISNYHKLMGKTCIVKGVEWVCVWADDIGGITYSWIWERFEDYNNPTGVEEYPKWQIELDRVIFNEETNQFKISIRKVVGDGVFGEWDLFIVRKDELDTLTKTVSYSQFLIEWCSEIVDGLTDDVY